MRRTAVERRSPLQRLTPAAALTQQKHGCRSPNGGVPAGGLLAWVACSKPCAMRISCGSPPGLPEKLDATGTPIEAGAVGEENPAGKVIAGRPVRSNSARRAGTGPATRHFPASTARDGRMALPVPSREDRAGWPRTQNGIVAGQRGMRDVLLQRLATGMLAGHHVIPPGSLATDHGLPSGLRRYGR